RFPPQQLELKLHRSDIETEGSGEKKCRWEASADFRKVPAGEFVDLFYEHLSSGEFLQHHEGSTSLAYQFQADTAEVTRWYLMPAGKEYKHFHIIRYPTGKPGKVEPVRVVTEYMAGDYTILAYTLLSVKAGYTYEDRWYYK